MAVIKRDPRAGLIAKIHVAKKQLAVADDSYRAMLLRVTGCDSCSDMTERQLEDVVNEFKRLGFKKSPQRKASRKQADSAQATKIRALWLNLYHLGEVQDSSEAALAAYAKRMAKVNALQWMSTHEANDIIKGLRGWLTRIGYHHPTADDVRLLAHFRMTRKVDAAEEQQDYAGIAAKVSMIRRQLEVMGALARHSEPLPEMVETERLDFLIEKYGAFIREMKGGAA